MMNRFVSDEAFIEILDEFINGQSVKLFLNDTQVTTLTTNTSGYIEFRRHFDPGNESDTYNVQVTYDGTGNQTATSNATALDGSSYTVCSVTYFQYRATSNMTVVTVEPHAAEVLVPIKSNEEMQHDAEAGGHLQVWHEFGWWYPWYRLHVKISINPTWDVGFNPLLPDESSGDGFGNVWDFFQSMYEEFAMDFVLGVAQMTATRFAAYIGERYFILNVVASGIISLAGGVAAGIELALNWNNKAALFGSAFAALMAMAVTGGWRLAPVFVELISYLLAHATLQGLGEVLAGISQALTAAVALLFRSWIDVAEVLIGAGLIVAALTRALTL